jgi:tetraacyldisaccharide-1-P 4'-kinase
MRTFEVTIDETIGGRNPQQALQEVKGVVQVEEKKLLLTAKDWVRPGPPASEEEIEQLAMEAEESTVLLPLEEAKALTHKRFKANWK